VSAGIAAHLFVQDAFATLLRAEALPRSLPVEGFTAFRIGTGGGDGLGSGLSSGHRILPWLVKSKGHRIATHWSRRKSGPFLSGWSSHSGTTLPRPAEIA
jgi:hypothetical protein